MTIKEIKLRIAKKESKISIHLNKVALGIFLQGLNTIAHHSLELISLINFFQIKQFIIELNLIVI
jgi:hypothetical protein